MHKQSDVCVDGSSSLPSSMFYLIFPKEWKTEIWCKERLIGIYKDE